jgi:hypothetical protein
MKDRQGNKITFKEYIERWKKGITEVTPLQKVKIQLSGTEIMLFGLFAGLIVSLIGYKNLWWVAIIILGGIFNTIMQYISLLQQRNAFQNLDNNSVDLKDITDKLGEMFKESNSEQSEEIEMKEGKDK